MREELALESVPEFDEGYDVRTAHEIADDHLEKLWGYLRDDPRAKPENCRRLIDEWLDFRLAHAAHEKPALPLPK